MVSAHADMIEIQCSALLFDLDGVLIDALPGGRTRLDALGPRTRIQSGADGCCAHGRPSLTTREKSNTNRRKTTEKRSPLIGAQLKWEQRRDALSRGIRHMEWTFDPLAIPNAFLNIHRLGAISRTYLVDFYGLSCSRLQGGFRPTVSWPSGSWIPLEWKQFSLGAWQQSTDSMKRILVPSPIDQWKGSEETRARAVAVQQENRQKFQDAFSRGLAVISSPRDAEETEQYVVQRRQNTSITNCRGVDEMAYGWQGELEWCGLDPHAV